MKIRHGAVNGERLHKCAQGDVTRVAQCENYVCPWYRSFLAETLVGSLFRVSKTNVKDSTPALVGAVLGVDEQATMICAS